MPKKRADRSHAATWAFLLTLALCGIGLLFVFESSVAESLETFGDRYYLVKQQALGFGVGLVAMITGIIIPGKLWTKLAPVIFFGGVVALVATLLPGIGLEFNGARRWVSLGPIVIQPVEFFKFGLVAYFANWLSKHQRLVPFLFLAAIPAVLLLIQPDLGSLLLVLGVALGLYFLSGGEMKKIALIVAIGLPIVVGAILASPYRLQRLKTFINPELDPLGSSFHIRQITFALGRGGLFGQGIGNSSQKFSYIPEVSTDSIFAIVAEEVGFLGSTAIIGMFIALLFLMIKSAQRPGLDQPQRLLLYGIALWIGLQTILNLSAVVGLVPLTGIPLPYFSYGRSSLIMILFATGVAIRIMRSKT